TRDAALAEIQPYLMANGIHSRGRFGAWRYEISNMDHSVMQGVEVVNSLLLDEPAKTWEAPRSAVALPEARDRPSPRRSPRGAPATRRGPAAAADRRRDRRPGAAPDQLLRHPARLVGRPRAGHLDLLVAGGGGALLPRLPAALPAPAALRALAAPAGPGPGRA